MHTKEYQDIQPEDTTEKNQPFTAEEIRGWKESLNGKRGTILNEHGNRETRRDEKMAAKRKLDKRPVINNRKKCAARKGNKLFVKMSEFHMAVRGAQITAGKKSLVHTQEEKVFYGISKNTVPPAQRWYNQK